jgi:NhaA family Na+:H+ antiporter
LSPSSALSEDFKQSNGGELGAGLVLIAAAAAAIALANSPAASAYHSLFHDPLPASPLAQLTTLHDWINDALMALFFFTVGLEIKREVLQGELATPAKRRLPVLAALTGMAAPALVFLSITGHLPALRRGWAIPAATDIAFAVGVIALVGGNLPRSLRLFLLTVAIVDDLGAVTIIALVYTVQIAMGWLLAGGVALAAMAFLARQRVTRALPFIVLALALWYCVLRSGVHPTVAGVLAAFAIPLRPQAARGSLLLRMEHALAPWNGYLIVPLFGFANAGVSLAGSGPAGMLGPLPLAIAAGLLLGKQAGVFGAVVLADRSGFAHRPAGASWPQIWGTALLCGIGFTMSLFIAALAFPIHPELVEEAKIGVLIGSLASAVLGFLVLRLNRR